MAKKLAVVKRLEQHIAGFERKYPRCWEAVERVRVRFPVPSVSPQPETYLSTGTSPDALLPLLSRKRREQLANGFDHSFLNDLEELDRLSLWRFKREIYMVKLETYSLICNEEVTELPTRPLFEMPQRCIYVVVPDRWYHGFFVYPITVIPENGEEPPFSCVCFDFEDKDGGFVSFKLNGLIPDFEEAVDALNEDALILAYNATKIALHCLNPKFTLWKPKKPNNRQIYSYDNKPTIIDVSFYDAGSIGKVCQPSSNAWNTTLHHLSIDRISDIASRSPACEHIVHAHKRRIKTRDENGEIVEKKIDVREFVRNKGIGRHKPVIWGA